MRVALFSNLPQVVKSVLAYDAGHKLIGSMAERCKTVIERRGAMADN